MKLIKFLNDNKYIIIVIILIIYLFFIYERIEGFQVNERYDFKLSRLENLMEKFIKKLLVSEKDCRGRFTKYSECDKKCGFNSVQTRKYEILKEAEKGGKKCPYKNGYTESIDCYMDRCEIGETCEDNLDCESGNCNNGKCKEWAECSFNDLNMCNKTECKQLNEDQNFTNDEDGHYLYDNRINSCFFKTPAEIEDEEIQVYSYEYNSTAPFYKVEDCPWYQQKDDNNQCVNKNGLKRGVTPPQCGHELMGPKPTPYNINIACSKCILDGSEWQGVDKCNCSPGGKDYETQYITGSDKEGKCLKISKKISDIGEQTFFNCEKTTFIGYSDRSDDSKADETLWSNKYKYRSNANEFDPCVSISDPRYSDTSPGTLYNNIVTTKNKNNKMGIKFIEEKELIKGNYNGSATEFPDLKTAQKFCNSLVYKNNSSNKLSRCGFVLGYGYMNGYSSGIPMNASIVGNCNSELTYNVNYVQKVPEADSGKGRWGQDWSKKPESGGSGTIDGPRSRMPLRCSNEYVKSDSVCPFYLDKGSPGDPKKFNVMGNGSFSGNKNFDSWWWNTGKGLQDNINCSGIPNLFCEYTTYWDGKNSRKPCKLINGSCSNSPADSPSCNYRVSEYCMSAINMYSPNKEKTCIKDVSDINNHFFEGVFDGNTRNSPASPIFKNACSPVEFQNYCKGTPVNCSCTHGTGTPATSGCTYGDTNKCSSCKSGYHHQNGANTACVPAAPPPQPKKKATPCGPKAPRGKCPPGYYCGSSCGGGTITHCTPACLKN